MENNKKIYVVSSYGGQYEDKWEHNECAFLTREAAQNFIIEKNAIANKVDKELYDTISEFICEKEEELWELFYDIHTMELLPGKSEEEYNKMSQDFHDNGKYNLIKIRFNIDRETWDTVEYHHDWDFCDYSIDEIDFYEI